MIGRLLQSAASTFSQPPVARPPPPLESVTEEAHTRELLYPNIQSLRAALQSELPLGSSARLSTARDAANYDDRGALDLAFPGDIRVLVAQDAHSRHHQPQVLYDSRPARGAGSASETDRASPRTVKPSITSPGANKPANRASITSGSTVASPGAPPRHRQTPSGSFFFSALSPTSPRSPSDTTKSRFAFGADARSRALPDTSPESETAQGKLAREAKEDTEALLGCMFGAPGFRLEPGTKLHILPKKAADGDAYGVGKKTTSNAARPISSGRGAFQPKRTPLVRSTSVADVPGAVAVDGVESRAGSAKPSIMFTRLFTVTVTESPTDNIDEAAASKSANGSPTDATAPSAPNQVKQKKVPMYAIALILQLPSESAHRPRPAHSPQGLSPLGSSLNESTPATSWRGEQSAFASFMEIRSHGPFDTVLNSYIPHVLQHWNVVNRALELLELGARAKLGILLEQANPLPYLTPAPSPKTGTTKLKKPKPQNQQSVYVLPGCLQSDASIKKMVEGASQRIVSSLRTRRVVIGQGRWGAWREEARWVGRWAGGKEQNFFLFNFLTAFLGTHTEWLEQLAPAWYRKRHAIQQRLKSGSSSAAITHRTVIVAADKMAARRLIFLLAAFLPSHLNHHPTPVMSRESSALLYAESPPPFLTRRAAPKTSLGRRSGHEASGHMRSVSFSLLEDGPEGMDDAARSRARRDSDARSLRNAALTGTAATGEAGSRKASMSTVIADTVQAVPHFATSGGSAVETPESPGAERKRPVSGESMASFVLSSTLRRSESTAGSTTGSAGGRWGSMVSGFWSSRRDSSTDDSDVFVSSQESPRRATLREPSIGAMRIGEGTSRHAHRASATGLERMVEEADALRNSPAQPSLLSGSPRRPLVLEECLRPRHPALQEGSSAARNIPRPRKPERLPLKLSFNEDEGFIDIAMDAGKEPSFSSSLASSFASLRPTFPAAGSTHDTHASPYGSVTSDSPAAPRSEPALDVAGWLKAYQPDFVLQAVRAYEELRADVDASMIVEAALAGDMTAAGGSSATSNPASSGWTDISTTLIADTTRFTIERLRLVRRPKVARSASSEVPDRAASNWETRLLAEPVMDLDPILTDAVERILALSGPSSRASSPTRTKGSERNKPGSKSSKPGSMSSKPPSVSGERGERSERHERSKTSSASAPHSKASSISGTAEQPSAPRSIRPEALTSSALAGPVEPPHAECRRAVLGALEEVARSVAAERSGRAEGIDHNQHHSQRGPSAQRDGERREFRTEREGRADTDSTLRAGVRRWMRGVETWS